MVTSVSFLLPRPTEESDFLRLKEYALVHDSWQLEYDKNGIKIWSKIPTDTTTKIIKVWAIFPGFPASVLFNTLMDNIYRREWDSNYIMGYEIGLLNSNNAVSYYATSCPPLKSRDFVLQTSWYVKNTDNFILNHSVCHKDHPPRPNFVRAISYFTGYYIRPGPENECEMTFVSQLDPQGMIPTWIVNKLTLICAPRYVRKIEQAASGYLAWKVANDPTYFPWVYPEQLKVPQITIADCFPSEEEKQTPFFKYLLEKEMKINPKKMSFTEGVSETLPETSEKVVEERSISTVNQSSSRTTEELRRSQTITSNQSSGNLRKNGKRKTEIESRGLAKWKLENKDFSLGSCMQEFKLLEI